MRDSNLYIGRVVAFDDVTKDCTVIVPQLQGTSPLRCQAYLNDTSELATISPVPPGERVLVFFDGGDLNSQPYWMLVTVGLITTAKLSDDVFDAIDLTIPDGAVTSTKIFDNAVITSKIAADAVKATQIEAGAITTAKLDALAVTTDKLDALAVTAEKIAADTITGDKISAATTITVGEGTYKVKAIGGAGTATYLGITSAATPAYENANTPFYVGADQQLSIGTKLLYTGGNLTINGGGTFTGAVSGGTIDIGGSDASSFHVDSSGNMWTGNGAYASAPFKVSAGGTVYAGSFNLMAGTATRANWGVGTHSDLYGTFDGLFVDVSRSTLTAGLMFDTSGAGNDLMLRAYDSSWGGGRINEVGVNHSVIQLFSGEIAGSYAYSRLNLSPTAVTVNGSDLTVYSDDNGIKVGKWSGSSSYRAVESDNGYLLLGGNTGVYLRTKSTADYLYLGTNGANQLTVQADAITVSSYTFAGALPATSDNNLNTIRYGGFGIFYRYSSNRDRKESITPLSSTASVGACVDALQPVSYIERWMGEGEEDESARTWREQNVNYGFIAEDVFEVDPNLATVELGSEGDVVPDGWSEAAMLALAIAELKDLRTRVAALES